jgi:hypothetical protein
MKKSTLITSVLAIVWVSFAFTPPAYAAPASADINYTVKTECDKCGEKDCKAECCKPGSKKKSKKNCCKSSEAKADVKGCCASAKAQSGCGHSKSESVVPDDKNPAPAGK